MILIKPEQTFHNQQLPSAAASASREYLLFATLELAYVRQFAFFLWLILHQQHIFLDLIFSLYIFYLFTIMYYCYYSIIVAIIICMCM